MRNLGIAFLALIALFMGGCSILYIGPPIIYCLIDYSADCYYVALGAFIAVPILALALLLTWSAWLAYKRQGVKVIKAGLGLLIAFLIVLCLISLIVIISSGGGLRTLIIFVVSILLILWAVLIYEPLTSSQLADPDQAPEDKA